MRWTWRWRVCVRCTRTTWERDWRRENRGNYRYPENVLWEAVEGYLDLLDARQQVAMITLPVDEQLARSAVLKRELVAFAKTLAFAR